MTSPPPVWCIPRFPNQSLLGNLTEKESAGMEDNSYYPDDSASSLLLWVQYFHHTQLHVRHFNCTPTNPQHKTVWTQTRILPHDNHLLPWPAPPSSPILPFSSPSPFLSPFLLLPHLFYFLAGVSKQLKHLQGVTLRPHAPPNVASAGGKRQRWKGERFIRLFMVRVRLRKSQGCPLTLARAEPDKPSFPSARLSYPTDTFLSLSSSFPSLNCSA